MKVGAPPSGFSLGPCLLLVVGSTGYNNSQLEELTACSHGNYGHLALVQGDCQFSISFLKEDNYWAYAASLSALLLLLLLLPPLLLRTLKLITCKVPSSFEVPSVHCCA